jgi:hypothetical protein
MRDHNGFLGGHLRLLTIDEYVEKLNEMFEQRDVRNM